MDAPGERSLKGIGGWLLLVALGLCVQPLLLLKTLADNSGVFRGDTWRVLTTPGSPAYHPLWAPLLLAETGANLVLLAWSVVLLYYFFANKRLFPRLAVAFMGVSLAVVLGDFLVTNAIPAARAHFTPKEYGQVGRSLVGAAIWIPYFLRSRRVAATFVR